MSKKPVVFLTSVFLGILLTSCQIIIPTSHLNTNEPIKKTITGVASTTQIDLTSPLAPTSVPTTISSPTTAILPSRTPQPVPSFTPSPSFTPLPSSTPLPLAKLNERGAIWILEGGRSNMYFRRLNLDNGEITIVPVGYNCVPGLFPGTEQVVCGRPWRYFFRNLVTKDEQHLPIKNTCSYYGWSPNGRFLIYEYCGEQGNYTIATYDLVEQIEQEIVVFTQPAGERLWIGPLISYDGTHVSIFYSDLIADKISEHRQFVLPDLDMTDDFDLSPVANQMVYGATDIFQEIMPRPNYLYLYDFDSGEHSLLATAPEGQVYDWVFSTPIWSPDGSKVVVTSGSYLCVVEIASRKQTCHDLSPYDLFRYSTWSPGSQSIALAAGQYGDADFISDLVIFDVVNGSYFVLLSNIDHSSPYRDHLFWR